MSTGKCMVCGRPTDDGDVCRYCDHYDGDGCAGLAAAVALLIAVLFIILMLFV